MAKTAKGAPRADWDPRNIAPRHENLKETLSSRGISRNVFAGMLGVSASTLDRWLDGADSPAQTIPNDKLAQAACMLGVSVWHLLDLTGSQDGEGARPLECHRWMRDWWKVARDTYQAAQWHRYEDYRQSYRDAWGNETITGKRHIVDAPGQGDPKPADLDSWSFQGEGMELQAWQIVCVDGKRNLRLSKITDEHIEEELGDAADRARQIPGFAETEEAKAAAAGVDAYMEWLRASKAERFRRDLLDQKGDFRDPAGVFAALARYAADHGGVGGFDAMAAGAERMFRKAANSAS